MNSTEYKREGTNLNPEERKTLAKLKERDHCLLPSDGEFYVIESEKYVEHRLLDLSGLITEKNVRARPHIVHQISVK